MNIRLKKVKALLEKKQLDGIVILTDFNRRYLSGFTGSS
ncbi:aminopeptidase P family N-terminal domain-containing protein, partial [Staphylococcus chromogenes]